MLIIRFMSNVLIPGDSNLESELVVSRHGPVNSSSKKTVGGAAGGSDYDGTPKRAGLT